MKFCSVLIGIKEILEENNGIKIVIKLAHNPKVKKQYY